MSMHNQKDGDKSSWSVLKLDVPILWRRLCGGGFFVVLDGCEHHPGGGIDVTSSLHHPPSDYTGKVDDSLKPDKT